MGTMYRNNTHPSEATALISYEEGTRAARAAMWRPHVERESCKNSTGARHKSRHDRMRDESCLGRNEGRLSFGQRPSRIPLTEVDRGWIVLSTPPKTSTAQDPMNHTIGFGGVGRPPWRHESASLVFKTSPIVPQTLGLKVKHG